jgi:hypothetical protein
MEDLSEYRGRRQLPRAYRVMFENDPHPPGSIDRILWDQMVRLSAATAPSLYSEFTPTRVAYAPGSRPELERLVQRLGIAEGSEEERVGVLARFAAGIVPASPVPLDQLKFGGSEEEIIARGSDWCTDVARVACGLSQVAGLPSRLVILEDTGRAYSGHTIVETWRSGTWGAVDPVRNLVYRTERGTPATTWDLMSRPGLLAAQAGASSDGDARLGQFSWAAIANYPLGTVDSVDYSIGPINQYYRTILSMSERGWPGGLRWLYEEDHEHGSSARPTG